MVYALVELKKKKMCCANAPELQKSGNKSKQYIFKQIAQYFGLKTNLFQGLKEGLSSNRNIGQFFLNIYCFVLSFCLLLHRLSVRISLPFYIFLQV